MPTEKEYLLKEQTAELLYQEKLTAGANITISTNNVISAVDTPATTVSITPTYNTGTVLSTVNINGNNSYIYNPDTIFTGATSTVNGRKGLVPTPYTTDVNKVLYGNGSWGALPQATTVIANPASSPTATLEKLQVGNTIYEIQGGGGGVGSTVTITPSLARGTKIADYSIDGVSGELLSNIKSISQSDYNALPSSKLTDNIVYFINDPSYLDPNYNYYTSTTYGDTLIIRVYHEGLADEEIRWYFHNFTQSYGLIGIPQDIAQYYTASGASSAVAYDTGTNTVYGWMAVSDYQGGVTGIYQGGWNNYGTGPIDAVVTVGGGAEQATTYEDPYVYVINPSYKIILNGVTYTDSQKTFTGATASDNGDIGFVPAPVSNDRTKFLCGDGTWATPSGGGGGSTCYLNAGQISDGPGQQYMTATMDIPFDNGIYYAFTKNNSSIENNLTLFEWSGSGFNLTVGQYSLIVSQTQIQCTSYPGSWANVYLYIIKII